MYATLSQINVNSMVCSTDYFPDTKENIKPRISVHVTTWFPSQRVGNAECLPCHIVIPMYVDKYPRRS